MQKTLCENITKPAISTPNKLMEVFIVQRKKLHAMISKK